MKLNQFEIYSKSDKQINSCFLENTDSKLNVHIDIKKSIIDNDKWIDMMEFSIPYILKALEKPNKQIVTEEEVVKIEKIKKVTVESIKHLSKNTNLIDRIDEETGDIIPAKILNAFKEENFITYENRFIYSLILMMCDFIRFKKDKGLIGAKGKNQRKLEYTAKSRVEQEHIKMTSEILLERKDNKDTHNDKQTVEKRIQKIEEQITQLKATEMFKLIDGARVVLVKSPLKMTNVLLKNVNFQYAVKLWDFLSDNFDQKNKELKEKKDYEDTGVLKNLFDESFLINYIDFDLLKTKEERQNVSTVENSEMVRNITNSLIEKILELNPDMTESGLKEIIAEKYVNLRKKNQANIRQIEEIYKKKIKEYTEKIKLKKVQ